MFSAFGRPVTGWQALATQAAGMGVGAGVGALAAGRGRRGRGALIGGSIGSVAGAGVNLGRIYGGSFRAGWKCLKAGVKDGFYDASAIRTTEGNPMKYSFRRNLGLSMAGALEVPNVSGKTMTNLAARNYLAVTGNTDAKNMRERWNAMKLAFGRSDASKAAVADFVNAL